MELKWPRENCPNCNADLTGTVPQPTERGLNERGKPCWTDFCPTCGYGMEVGDRNETPTKRHPEPGSEPENIVEPETVEGESSEPAEPAGDATSGAETGKSGDEGTGEGDGAGNADEAAGKADEGSSKAVTVTAVPEIVDGKFPCPLCNVNHVADKPTGKRCLRKISRMVEEANAAGGGEPHYGYGQNQSP